MHLVCLLPFVSFYFMLFQVIPYLNHMGLNSADSPTCGFFSMNIYFSTTGSMVGWICRCRTMDIWRATIKLYEDFFIYSFLTLLGLCCCVWAFSSCGMGAFHCSGFSCGVWALGFCSYGTWAKKLQLLGSKAQAK